MLSDRRVDRRLVAGAAGSAVCLALAGVVAVMAWPGGSGDVPAVAASGIPAESPAPSVAPVQAPPPPPVAAATVPKPAPAPAATKRATSAPKPAAAVASAPPPAAASPPPPKVVLPPRRQPSSAEVQQAIKGLQQYVDFTPTPAQVAQAGDMVCDAFDQGQTFAQVKAAARSMVPSYFEVKPGADDYVVRTAVRLYCPAYTSRLA